MKILAIETSCDETAVSILECSGDEHGASFTVLGNALISQIDIHREFGGVFPAVAKREHAKNLVPLLAAALEEAELLHEDTQTSDEARDTMLRELLAREPELADALLAFLGETERPQIDAIAVTAGPGLEPALWVGVNFARALAHAWKFPIVPVNHLEGHMISSLTTTEDGKSYTFSAPPLPLLSLIISGGHTEIVVSSTLLSYQRVGQTRDDAVGEAYDKAARMLELGYPGGPEMSRLAEEARAMNIRASFTFPRPMIDTSDCDFSFSGLKTAVLYKVKEESKIDEDMKRAYAREFDDAVTDVLTKKVLRAVESTSAQSLALGGGVSASGHIREAFQGLAGTHGLERVYIPERSLTGDNAIMIGMAGFFHALREEFTDPNTLKANGNQSLA